MPFVVHVRLFEQMTGTEPSNPGHELHKTGALAAMLCY